MAPGGIQTSALGRGAWSAQAPRPNADVWIPPGAIVTLDTSTAPIHALRIDGVLEVAADADAELRADTIVVSPGGTLEAAPKPGHSATIRFTGGPPAEPGDLGPGLISAGSLRLARATLLGQGYAHVLVLSPNTALLDVHFVDMGRTPGEDPVDAVRNGGAVNGRYALFFDRIGTATAPALVRHCTLDGGPGWGFV